MSVDYFYNYYSNKGKKKILRDNKSTKNLIKSSSLTIIIFFMCNFSHFSNVFYNVKDILNISLLNLCIHFFSYNITQFMIIGIIITVYLSRFLWLTHLQKRKKKTKKDRSA